MSPDPSRRFGAGSTAAEVVAGIDLTGRRAVVTGASSGIGVETARALAGAGAEVTLAVRDLAAGRAVAADLARGVGADRVAVAELHLDDLASVHRFVRSWSGPLDVLVANAGIMDAPEAYTAAGWESQLAVNHLGHAALTLGLRPALEAAGAARVVVLSSSGHSGSPVVFDDLFFRRRGYDPQQAYAQSKTANCLFAVGLGRHWTGTAVTANACMPGGIWTGLQKHWDPARLAALQEQARDVVKTVEQGAATSVYLATAPELAGVTGRYFEDCHEADLVDEVVDGLHGVRAWALDPVAADRLWDVTAALLDAEHRRLGLD